MRSTAKVLRFPLSGIARDIDYRKAYIPEEETTFATPFAVNVRGSDSFHRRDRGGSRPGLKRVTGTISVDNGGKWLWPNGEEITWPDGANMVFSDATDTITAPDGSKVVNPHAEFAVNGLSVEGAHLSAFYRNRLVIAKDAVWYMSGTGDLSDWDFGRDADNTARAVAGNIEFAGVRGETITAIIPIRDKFLFIATQHSLWRMDGEPTSGTLTCVSEHVGCVSANAWAFDGVRLWLVSNQGLYASSLGEVPVRVSNRIPEEFNGLASALLIHDADEDGIHIFGEKPDGTASDWYYDIANKAFWAQVFTSSHRPVAACWMILNGVGTCIFRGTDGHWRHFDDETAKDDGVDFDSCVAIGPIRTGMRDDIDGMVGEVDGVLAAGSSNVSLEIYSSDSPEGAVIAAQDPLVHHFEAQLSAGRNKVIRPRQRGAWAVFVIKASGRWGYESILTVMKHLGRLR